METAKLAAIYRYVFNRAFQDNLENRIRLQKTIYAMSEANMSCGNYAFMWDEHGPFSSELSRDISTIDYSVKYHLCYDSEGKRVLKRIKEMFTQIPADVDYQELEWIESLMSIHYIQHYILRNSEKEKILEYLMKSKPKLKSGESNQRAFEVIQNFA